jgi:hypothetical protein
MVQLSIAFALTALAATAAADLQVLVPGGPNLWWVGKSSNTLAWSCHDSPYTNFTVLIANKDPKILSAPLAVIAQQNNYDCSHLITQDQVNQTPATGYIVQLANPFNSSDVYAASAEFEIKALGSSYPDASATPAGVGVNTAAPTSSGGASASSTSTPKSSAVGLSASTLGALGAAAAALLSLF